jgi:hypothetical protein
MFSALCALKSHDKLQLHNSTVASPLVILLEKDTHSDSDEFFYVGRTEFHERSSNADFLQPFLIERRLRFEGRQLLKLECYDVNTPGTCLDLLD